MEFQRIVHVNMLQGNKKPSRSENLGQLVVAQIQTVSQFDKAN